MPDPLHAQVKILTELPHTIGKYIGRFKASATGRARRILDFPQDQALRETTYDWRLKASREGDICISPAISSGERAVFQAVVQAGGKAIHLAATALTPRYHPASRAMEAPAAGRFPVLSPLEEGRRHKALSWRVAMQLNAFAAAIAGTEAGGYREEP